MILSKRVALGDVQLDELHEAIVIRSINPGVPHENITAVSRMGGSGQRVTGQHWESLDVTVTYAIDIPKREMSLRRQIFDTVNAWAARRGWLTVNQMQNRKMYVDKVIFPSGGDMWDWLSEYTLTFRSYNVPFWQDITPAQAVSGITNNGSISLAVPGILTTTMDAYFENKSGMTINNFRITAGGNEIRLSSLGLGGTETLAINHGGDGLLQIKIGSRSVYHKYTGNDDLYVNPGPVGVSFSAERAGILTAYAWGRYV